MGSAGLLCLVECFATGGSGMKGRESVLPITTPPQISTILNCPSLQDQLPIRSFEDCRQMARGAGLLSAWNLCPRRCFQEQPAGNASLRVPVKTSDQAWATMAIMRPISFLT